MLALLGILAFVVAFVAARLLVTRFVRVALDEPNARSLHDRPMPRTGGIAVLLASALSFGFGGAQLWLPCALALALAVVSFLDDLYGVPTLVRLGSHIGAAGLVAWYLLTPMQPLELIVIVAGIAWITNLYNFMDGSDGLAGGMAVIGFGTYATASGLAGEDAMAAVCVALAAASGAFLVYNLHPAKLFLGDVGSIPLGFLAAVLGVVGWRDDLWPLWFPVLVFGPFIADATITLVKRLARGERVWQAHRSHYYQRMVLMGFGHRGTAYVLFALMIVCAAAALLGRNQAPHAQAIAFFSGSAVLAAVAIWVDVRWARFTRGTAKAG